MTDMDETTTGKSAQARVDALREALSTLDGAWWATAGLRNSGDAEGYQRAIQRLGAARALLVQETPEETNPCA